ncbi:MAG: hypothetical protein O6913_02190 [Chloroflexi bacterium]|nr:hypothetical protein [Chloroflexota bacterium]
MNRSKLAAGGLLSAVFISGVIVGGTGFTALADREEREEPRRPRKPYVEILQENLALTPPQRDTIEVLLEEFNTAFRQAWRELQDEEAQRNNAIRQNWRGEILRVLDDRQADTYRQMLARSDSARADRAARRRR